MNKSVKSIFNNLLPTYEEGWISKGKGVSNYIHEMECWAVEKLARYFNDIMVIDVGTGGGRWLNWFINKKAKMVVGTDVSANLLKLAKNEVKDQHNIYFQVSDALYLPYKKNKFDLANSSEVIYCVANRKKFLREQARVVKSGGYVICSIMNNALNIPWELSKRFRANLNKDPYSQIEYKMTSFLLKREFKEIFYEVKLLGFVFFPPVNWWYFRIPGENYWFPFARRFIEPIEKVLSRTPLKYFARVIVIVGKVR